MHYHSQKQYNKSSYPHVAMHVVLTELLLLLLLLVRQRDETRMPSHRKSGQRSLVKQRAPTD